MKKISFVTLVVALILLVLPAYVSANGAYPVINEFSADTTGTDVEYVEIFGLPNTDYSAFTILEIEGDSTGAGVIDEVIDVGTTDASGFWVVNLPANTLENGTITLLMVENFTGALNDDLDTDNDGTLDVTPWSSVKDGVAVNDGGASDRTYALPSLGVSYDGQPYAPGGASRIPDGVDTDSASDWVRNDFDLAGIPGYTGTISIGEAYNTPGESNVAYTSPGPGPEPIEVGGEIYPNNNVWVLTGGILAVALLSGAGILIRRRITHQ